MKSLTNKFNFFKDFYFFFESQIFNYLIIGVKKNKRSRNSEKHQLPLRSEKKWDEKKLCWG